MRYAIFSDVHGNLEAFEAVLGAISKDPVDRYLSAGDIVGYGADPSRCIALLRQLSCVTVAGNHDWAVSDLLDPQNLNEAAREAVLWTEGVISWDEIGYLKSLELVRTEKAFTIVHGSLERPEEFNYVLSERDARECFAALRTPLCFIGHSHVPGIFQWSRQKVRFHGTHKVKCAALGKCLVNVGSVGQPRDGDPRAAYAVYDDEKRTVEIHRVEYDIKTARDKILERGLPPALAYRLSTGT